MPVVCICGCLPLVAREQDRLMHHTLADGGRDEFIRAHAAANLDYGPRGPQGRPGIQL